MNKIESKQRCKEIVRESTRKEGLTKTSMMMELLPDLLDGISIDKSVVLATIGDEFDKPTANPLNLILKMFGMRIIHKQNTLQSIDGSMETVSSFHIEESDTDDASNLLALNDEAVKRISDAIAKKLGEFEKSTAETTQFLKKQNAALHSQIEKSEMERSQVSSDYDGIIKSVADRVQHILSLIGRDDSTSVFTQMNELLEDLELRAVWYTPDAANMLFTTLKCGDVNKHKEKPCILCGDKVVSKGVIFIRDEAANTSDNQNN